MVATGTALEGVVCTRLHATSFAADGRPSLPLQPRITSHSCRSTGATSDWERAPRVPSSYEVRYHRHCGAVGLAESRDPPARAWMASTNTAQCGFCNRGTASAIASIVPKRTPDVEDGQGPIVNCHAAPVAVVRRFACATYRVPQSPHALREPFSSEAGRSSRRPH